MLCGGRLWRPNTPNSNVDHKLLYYRDAWSGVAWVVGNANEANNKKAAIPSNSISTHSEKPLPGLERPVRGEGGDEVFLVRGSCGSGA